MAGHQEQPRDIEQVAAAVDASDPHPLAIKLAAATGIPVTIVHEGPATGRDPYAGAHYAALVALHRFGLASPDYPDPEGDK